MGILVRVIYCVRPGAWRVVVGPGVGMLDGGSHQTWPAEWIPHHARFPNAEFRIRGFEDGRPQVIELSDGTDELCRRGRRMEIAEEIIAARKYGVVRCGLSALAAPAVPDLASEFGLRTEAGCYQEIDEAAARGLARMILHRDMAYIAEVMPADRAATLADRFLAQFGPGTRYLSNGEWRLRSADRPPEGVICEGLDPATPATFDTALLIVGPERSGCLWIEDED